MKYAVLFLLFALPATMVAQDENVPPVELVTNHGCSIEGYSNGEYTVHVWADFGQRKGPGHDWVRLYSVRMDDSRAKNRDKSFDDCDKWMEKIEKLREKKAKAATEADTHDGKHR